MRLAQRCLLVTLLPLSYATAQVPKPDISGIWRGTLDTGKGKLQIQLHLETGVNGVIGCAMDSLDQRAFQMACTLAIEGDHITIAVPVVQGSWTGQIAADGQSLFGTWTQGGALSLSFTRQALAIPTTR